MDVELNTEWSWFAWPVTIVVAVATVTIGTLLHDVRNTYIRGLPPGPFSLPLIGGLYKLNPSQPHLSLENLVKVYGKIFRIQFGFLGPMVFVCDPELPYQTVCGQLNDRPPLPVFKYLNGEEEGIGSAQYSPQLKQLRMMCHQGISYISKASIYKHTNKAFKIFFENILSKNSEAFDPMTDIEEMSLALFSSYIYGIEYETFDDPLMVKLRYNRSVTISVLFPAHPFNIIPWSIHLPVKMAHQLKSALQDRDEVLHEQYTKLDTNKTTSSNNDTVLGKMAALRRLFEDSEKPGIEAVKISCWTLEAAGASTTLNTIQWLVLYMATHRDVQQKAWQCINNTSPDRVPTLADRSSLPYIEAIVMEVLRIAPPVPIGIPRTSLDREMILGKYNIPAGTMVLCNIWHIHHNKQYWPEPEIFKPERFLDQETGKCIPAHKLPYFMPFGHGKRSCVGQKFANEVLFLFACALIKCWDIEAVEPEKIDLRGRTTLGLEPFPHQIVWKLRKNIDIEQLFEESDS